MTKAKKQDGRSKNGRKPGQNIKHDHTKVIALYDTGISFKEISQQTGIKDKDNALDT